MPSTSEDRAARRESRRLNREENPGPTRGNLAGYQTESARLFGVSVSSDVSPSSLDNSDHSANRRRSSQMERNLSGIGEELNDSSEGGDNTMQPPGQDAAQSSSRSHRAGPFKKNEDSDYDDDDSNGGGNNPFVDAHDAGASNDDSGSGSGSRRSRSSSRKGGVPEQEFHPAKLDRSPRSENRSENADAFNMEDDLSPTSRPRSANMVASTLTTSSAATQRVANTEDDSPKNYYDLSRKNERNKFMGVLPDEGDDDDGQGYETSPLYNDIVQPSPFDASDKEDPYEHPQTYRPFSGGSQGSSTGEHYASMQELLDDEKSRSFVNHRKNRFGGCGFRCGFDSLFGGKRTKRRKITLLMIVLLLCVVIGICLNFGLGTGGGNKKGEINAQNMNQMPEREKPGQIVSGNTTGTDSTFGMDEHSDDVFSREPTFPDDSKLSEGDTLNSPSTAPSVSPVSATTLVPTPYDTAPTTAANPWSPEPTSSIVPTPHDTAPATNPNPSPTSTSSIVPTPYDAVYGTLRPTPQPSGSTSVSVPSLPPVTAAPVSYPTNPPIAISVPSVMTDISGELTFSEAVPQDTETSLIIFLDALKKSIRATIAPSLDTRDELVYVEIISINGEAVDSLLLRRRFIRRRLQVGSVVVYNVVVLSDCASSDCSDSEMVADDVYSRTTNEMSSAVTSGSFSSTLEVNMLSSSGGTVEYVGGVELGDFSEPKVTVLSPTVESGTNETSSSYSSCPPGLLQVDGLPGCCVPDTSYHGDGACDPDAVYNTAACNFDGGDCCKETCNLDSSYGCGGPQSAGFGPFGYYCQNPVLGEYINPDMCTVTNRSRVGDGRCDAGIEIYNTAACNWDGGDCCQQTCDERYAYFTCGDPAFPYDCQNPVHADSSNPCKFCEEGSFDPFLMVPGSTLNCDQLKSVVDTEETGSSTCLSVQQAEEFCCPKSVSTAVSNTTIIANATSEKDINDALTEADNVTTLLNGNETTFANLTSDGSNATEAVGSTDNVTVMLDGNGTLFTNLTSDDSNATEASGTTDNVTLSGNETTFANLTSDDVDATEADGTSEEDINDALTEADNVTTLLNGNETTFANLTSDGSNATEAVGSTDNVTVMLDGNETLFTNLTSDDSNATEAAGTTDNVTLSGNETTFANLTSDDVDATEADGTTDNVTTALVDNESNSTNLTFVATVTINGNETMSTNVTIDATITVVGNESISTNLTSADNATVPSTNATSLPTNETISANSTADNNAVDPNPILPINETHSANSTVEDNVVDPGTNATLGVPTNESISPYYPNSTAEDNMAPYTLLSQLQGLSASALYGFTVAMSSDGNVVAVGAKDKTDVSGGEVGAVLLYSMETSPPTLIQTLVNDESGGEFGNSIGLSNDGNRLVVGARSENVDLFEQAGVVRVYERDAIGQWVLMGTPIVGTSDGVRAGWSVSISGDGSSVAVGAPKGGESGGGAVFTYRFEDEDGTWIPYGTVLEGDTGEAFGYATSLSNDGNLMAVGTPKAAREGLQNVGKASVFYLFGTEWVPLAGGSEVYGIDTNDIDGTSVALSSQDGSILVIGGKGRDVDGVSNAGHCRIYKLGTEWELIHSIEGQTENGRLGTSVAVSSDGNIVACGGETDGNTGVVKVWNQATSESSTVSTSDKQEGALFGYAVSLNGDGKMLAVGAPEWYSESAGEKAGAVEIYTEFIS